MSAPARTCCVLLPAGDAPSYPAGHFRRVFEHVLAPAARAAGFVPALAGDPSTDAAPASVIALDTVRRAVDADVLLCDLSARDPAVLYALGRRQAFDTPIVLVKDRRTPRVFDVRGLREVAYDESLRVDAVATAVEEIGAALRGAGDAREPTAVRRLGERVARLEARGARDGARPNETRTRARFRRLARLVSTLDAGQSFTLDELVGPALSDDEAGVLAQALAAFGMAEPVTLGAVRPRTRLRRLGEDPASNHTRYFLHRDLAPRA